MEGIFYKEFLNIGFGKTNMGKLLEMLLGLGLSQKTLDLISFALSTKRPLLMSGNPVP